MGETKEYTGTFTLPERKVKVIYIKRKKGMAAGDHIGPDHIIAGGMIDNAVTKYVVPLNRSGGLVNVLTTEEKDYLEYKLRGANLSVYGDFWYDQSVLLTKQDTIFDLSNPRDYIQVAILKANKAEIAVGYSNRNKRAEYKFMIVEDGEKLLDDKKRYDFKKNAWKEYGRIEDQKDLLVGVLKLLENKLISEDSKLEWVQGKVESFVDEAPKRFLSVVLDPSFETRLLINKAIDKKLITRNGNRFATADGLELSEEGEIPTFAMAVRYLEQPKNQAVRDILEAKLSGDIGKVKKTKKK